MHFPTITAAELINNRSSNTCILDVRTGAEVSSSKLPDCILIPLHELTLDRLKAELAASGKSGDKIYLLCQSGRRALIAANQLKGQIESELVIVEGGMNALQQTNSPLQGSGKSVMSIERQVRIAAGFLVLTGVILGGSVNYGFYGLAGFVGAGLMFAGITDTCMMGMLIARMPWNK